MKQILHNRKNKPKKITMNTKNIKPSAKALKKLENKEHLMKTNYTQTVKYHQQGGRPLNTCTDLFLNSSRHKNDGLNRYNLK